MLPTALHRLIESLAALSAEAPDDRPAGVCTALRTVLRDRNWLPPERRRASHENYARHLLYADPAGRFSILSLVWAQGQASPVHGHHAWCAVGIYGGELTECFYRERRQAAPELMETTRRAPGSVTYDPAGGAVHRIANEGPDIAVSLHVYGTGADRISTGVNRLLG